MFRRSRLLCCALLALGILGVLVQAQGPRKGPVEKLADDITNGKKISEDEVKRLARRLDLEDVMGVYKPPMKGSPTLEARLLQLSKKRNFTQQDRKTLKKIAELSRAVAFLTPHYKDPAKKNAQKAKEWNRYSIDLDEGAVEMLRALKKGEDRKIAQAATRLSGTCTDCHSEFRNN